MFVISLSIMCCHILSRLGEHITKQRLAQSQPLPRKIKSYLLSAIAACAAASLAIGTRNGEQDT